MVLSTREFSRRGASFVWRERMMAPWRRVVRLKFRWQGWLVTVRDLQWGWAPYQHAKRRVSFLLRRVADITNFNGSMAVHFLPVPSHMSSIDILT